MASDQRAVLVTDVAGPSTSIEVPNLLKFKLSPAAKLLLSDNLNDILTGKRKATSEDEVSASEKRIRTEAIANLASVKTEARNLKIELIATKAQVASLESQLNRQRTRYTEMEILFEEEKGCLIAQHRRDERSVSDITDKMAMIKRRERDLMADYEQEKTDHKQYKMKWDKEKAELNKKVADLRDKLLECGSTSDQQMAEIRKDMDEMAQGLESSRSEVEILKAEVERLTERAKYCTVLRTKLDKQGFELHSVNTKVRELEYERDSFLDWKQQAKNAEKRLINMAELEREVHRLRSQEKNIRECIVNKLLLEEQVHVLESKVNATLPMQAELHEAKVKVATLEMTLEQWKAATRLHGIETPDALTSTLDTVLNKHLEATVESSEIQLRLSQVTEELETVKFERNKATGKVNELLSVRSNNEALIDRLQKKQQLIMADRESYRNLLTSYEKELATTQHEEPGSNSLELLKMRIEQQEQSLQRYRDLLIKHDPTELTKLLATLRNESGKRREENEFLKYELERLRRHRNSLLVHLERIGTMP